MAVPALIALTVASTAIGAISSINQGTAQRRIANANAEQAEREAGLKEAAGREEARKARVRATLTTGSQRAALGASGVRLSGSPLEVINRSAAELELDALKANFGGQVGAQQSRRQADLFRVSGKQAQRQGQLGAIQSVLQGGAQLAGAFAKPS